MQLHTPFRANEQDALVEGLSHRQWVIRIGIDVPLLSVSLYFFLSFFLSKLTTPCGRTTKKAETMMTLKAIAILKLVLNIRFFLSKRFHFLSLFLISIQFLSQFHSFIQCFHFSLMYLIVMRFFNWFNFSV